MKKFLLLACLCSVVSLSGWGFEAPTAEPNVSWQGISPDGRYLVSNLSGSLIIVDRVNDTTYSYEESESNSYVTGVGEIVSNTGIVLSSNSVRYNASYWENGEWKEVPVPNPNQTNSLHGITPDGSRIVGNVGAANIDIDASSTMALPAYWDRSSDGTYTLHTLPYPEKDFIGRVPQYVTATSVSDDGNVIVGQIVDYSGSFNIPLVYTQNADGEWVYTSVLEKYFTIDGEIPEDPGEAPALPDPMDYMSAEGKAEYDKAYDAWIESGYDYTLYPDPEDFLEGEEKAAYTAAKEQYDVENAAWQEKAEVFYAFFETLQSTLPVFGFNDTCISADGKKITQVEEVVDYSDPMAWFPTVVKTPWVIDIATGEVEKLDFGKSIAVTQILPDNTYLAYNGVGAFPATGYVIKDGECEDLYNYLSNLSPEMAEWCEKNLTHEIEKYDWETGETTFEEYVYTGMCLASRDMKVILCWSTSDWDYDYFTFGYVFDVDALGSVDTVEADENHIGFDPAGNLILGDDVTAVSVYDLSGRLILDNGAKSSALAPGIYIVRAQRNNGSTISAKLCK